MSISSGHRLRTFASVIVLSVAVVGGPGSPAAASSTLAGHFYGQAWSAEGNAKAGDVSVRLGRSSYQPCPCLGTDGSIKSNTITDIDMPHIAHLDVTRSTAQASKSNHGTTTVRMTAKVAGLDLLDGLITADAIKAVSTTNATAGSITASAAGSTFVKLKVLGHLYGVNAGPNKRISLPGVGYVVLREQHRTGNSNQRRGLDVTMLRVHVSVDDNAYDLPVGAEIVVAAVRSAYDRSPVKVAFRGSAYGSASATEAGPWANRLGKSAVVYLSCESTHGVWRTNTVDQVRVGNLLRLGTVVSRTKSNVVNGVGTATARSEIQAVKLGGSTSPLISLTALKSVARATWDRNTNTGSWSTSGSQLVDLSIPGVLSLPIVIPPNTEVDVPGLGHLTLFERKAHTTATSVSVQVVMLHLVVSANALGIPVGTNVVVGFARATAMRP